MYLRSLHVQNVKLLRDVKIGFTKPDGSPRMWTVFVGENRLCKTTLLQTIAAASLGRDRGTSLVTDVVASWPDLRGSQQDASVDATFSFSARHHADRAYPTRRFAFGSPPTLVSSLALKAGHSILEGRSFYEGRDELSADEDPLGQARLQKLAHWLSAGYGTSRQLSSPGRAGTARVPDGPLDRLRPLFGEGLIGTGFVELLPADLALDFAKVLQEVLIAGELLPNVTGLELRGRGGIRSSADLVSAQRFEMDLRDAAGKRVKIPAAWLSQGYQSTIAWVADIVGQVFLEAEQAVPAEDMEGLVLIDEIDLHLHPTWQVRLIPALRKVFPRLQFIATTHSPMMLPGLEAGEVFTLTQDDAGSVVATPSAYSPALLTGSELLERYFEITKLYPNDLGEKLRRFGYLASDPYRSDEEDAEEKELRKELAAAGVELDREAVPREALE